MKKIYIIIALIAIGTNILAQDCEQLRKEDINNVEKLLETSYRGDPFLEKTLSKLKNGDAVVFLWGNNKPEGVFDSEYECKKWIEDHKSNTPNSRLNDAMNSQMGYRCIPCEGSGQSSPDAGGQSPPNILDHTTIAAKSKVDYGQNEVFNRLANENTLGDIESSFLNSANTTPTTTTMSPDLLVMPKQSPPKQDVPCINIGTYHGQDVCKKGDTIFVAAINKKYLLSMQTMLNNKSVDGYNTTVSGINDGIIKEDGWYLGDNNNVIGYITTESKIDNSTGLGEMIRFAENAVDCKFHELSCDNTILDKFTNYCDWEICRMINTINVFNLSYSDYQKMINDDITLNNKIIALKAKDIVVQVLNYKVGEKTDNLFDMNTSISDFTYSSIINAITNNGNIKGDLGNCLVSVKNYIDIAMQKEAPDDLKNKTLAQLFETKDEQLKNRYTSEMGILLTNIWHGAYDVVSNCAGDKAAKELLVFNMLPELFGITAMEAANLTIKYSIAPEYKKSMETLIDNSRVKKAFLEKIRNEYQPLFKKNLNNCFQYTKTVEQLSSEVFNSLGEDENSREELMRMRDYVFGNAKIGQCNVLSAFELKPVQPRSETLKPVQPRREPIGKYGEEIVYYSNDSIFVGEKVYLLALQPRQDAFSNSVTKFNGNIKRRFFIMYCGKSLPQINDFHNENIIGWVDDDYKGKHVFSARTGNRVEGVNLFGSLYIGPNNPTYTDGKHEVEIYTLPYQDNVDEAAMEHDRCYGEMGANGGKDALFNLGVVDCDKELVMRCLATLQIHVEDNMTQNAIDLIKNKLDWNKSSIANLTNHEQITDPTQRAKYVATFFLSALAGKGWGLIFKTIKSTTGNQDNYQQANTPSAPQTIPISTPTTLTSASTGEQFEAQPGDTIVGGEMKDGKVVQGKVIRNGEPVKVFTNKRNF